MNADNMKDTAWRIACEAHEGQKYGDLPYTEHLLQVERVLREYQFISDLCAACAYLHDVLEDGNAGIDWGHRISEELGDDVLCVVQFCTDEPGPNRKTRKAATYARCRAAILHAERHADSRVYLAIAVKLADRLANLRNAKVSNPGLLHMYRKEREAFKTTYCIPQTDEDMWDEYEQLLS